MNNQYNPQQQPQQQMPQQPQPQQYQQQPGQYRQQPQPQQYQQQYIPPKPMVDPAVVKKQKKDAFAALSEKTEAFMQVNPILRFIAPNSEMISYIATGVSALLTIIMMCLGRFSIVFPLVALIFGALSISNRKRTILPLAISVSSVALFSFICLIHSIIYMATSIWALSGGFIISFIFSLLELGVLAYLTTACWLHFAATLPPKAYQPMPQPYYGQPQQPAPQPIPQPAQTAPAPQPIPQPVQAAPAPQPIPQPVQAAPTPQPIPQPVQAAPTPQPVQQPSQQPAEPTTKTCASCGTSNSPDAAFCKVCGAKLN